MRLAMLARNPNLYSHKRLAAAAAQRGHSIDVINTLHVHMNITSNKPMLRYGGKKLPVYDAVIPRIGASITRYGHGGVAPVRNDGRLHLERKPTPSGAPRQTAHLQLLAREGSGLPVTGFTHNSRNT